MEVGPLISQTQPWWLTEARPGQSPLGGSFQLRHACAAGNDHGSRDRAVLSISADLAKTRGQPIQAPVSLGPTGRERGSL